MKILHVTHRMYPSSGGGAYVVKNLSIALRYRKNDVTIISSDYKCDINYNKEIENFGVEVIQFPVLINLFQFIITPKMKSWLKNNIKDYDIIHLHGIRSYQNILLLKYAEKYNIPIIIHSHGSIEKLGNKVFSKKLFDKLFLKKIISNSNRFITLSLSEKESHLAVGVPEHKLTILPNGINLKDFEQIPKSGLFRTKYGIDKNKIILLYIGRIDETKGLDFLISSYKQLLSQNDSLLLILAGPDSGYKKELKKQISANNLDKYILLLDYISEYEKKCAFIDSHVFVTPRFYGFPITFVESCGCSLPIVTTNGGDYLEWINNNTGFSTNYDIDEYSNAIMTVINNRNLHITFSNNCKKIVEESFNWNVIAKQIETIYQQERENKNV